MQNLPLDTLLEDHSWPGRATKSADVVTIEATGANSAYAALLRLSGTGVRRVEIRLRVRNGRIGVGVLGPTASEIVDQVSLSPTTAVQTITFQYENVTTKRLGIVFRNATDDSSPSIVEVIEARLSWLDGKSDPAALKPLAKGWSPLTEDIVAAVYDQLLGRRAETDEVVREQLRLHDSVPSFLASIVHSQEYLAYCSKSPLFHYSSCFDVPAMLSRFEMKDRVPVAGHVVNFIGVRVSGKFLPAAGAHLAGTVEGLPIPGNWHSDLAEFGAALRAVALAKRSFVMAELGCGWGCWMNITAAAARRRNLDFHVIGVEADSRHLEFARECCETNGLHKSDHTLYRGIAAVVDGVSLFPKQDPDSSDWGEAPIFGPSRREEKRLLASGRYERMPHVALDNVIGSRPRLDLLHIDIQGGEADLLRGCIDLINQKVAYLVIGAHSRLIEGQLIEMLISAGWILEVERPAVMIVDRGKPRLDIDGVQGWRNPRLCAAEA